MIEQDPIDFGAWATPDPSPSLTRDILDRVGREGSAAPGHAARRLAVIGAVAVAAAAAVLAWKLRDGGGEHVAPAVTADQPADPIESPPTPPTERRSRMITAETKAELLAAIAAAHEQRPPGGSQAMSLTRVEIQAAMEEVRPLIAECHEMALERTPSLAGALKVKMELVGEPGLATIVASAEAEPDAGLAGDPDFLECVTETLLSLELPAPAVGGTMGLTYPFVFRARNDAEGPTHRLPPSGSLDPPSAELVNQARAAAKGAEWGRALKLVQQALAQDPADQDGLMVGVLAACKLQNGDRAKDFARRLSSKTRRGMARQACLKNGIEVGDD